MTITQDNYATLRDAVEGRDLNSLTLPETYTALCYLTHRANAENADGAAWTRAQIGIVRARQRALLAERGIYVLTAR